MNFDKKYREWVTWPDCVTKVNNLPNKPTSVFFYREKKSHRGLSQFKTIKKLCARQVNQDFLNEISKIENLEYLEMEVVTAENLSVICELKKLRNLKIDSIRKAKDFTFIKNMKSLNKLFIENAKHIDSLLFLSKVHYLTALGIEGSMYTKQKIESLEPLSKLKKLEALFMSSVQLKDKNLDYLSTIPNLKYLGVARFAPKENFDSLRNKVPKLVCKWCDTYEI